METYEGSANHRGTEIIVTVKVRGLYIILYVVYFYSEIPSPERRSSGLRLN